MRLAGLGRQAQLLGMTLGEEAQDKLERCTNFQVDFDSRLTTRYGFTAQDGRTGETTGAWRVKATDAPIDITTLGSGPLTFTEFAFETLLTYPCGNQAPLKSYTRGISTAPGRLQLLLVMDLNPREPARPGETPSPPPQDSLQVFLPERPKETYRHWNEGCNNPYTPTDDTQARWADAFNSWHGQGGFPLKLLLRRGAQTGDLLHAESWNRTRGGYTQTGGGSPLETEFTTIELRHTPLK